MPTLGIKAGQRRSRLHLQSLSTRLRGRLRGFAAGGVLRLRLKVPRTTARNKLLSAAAMLTSRGAHSTLELQLILCAHLLRQLTDIQGYLLAVLSLPLDARL